MIDDIDSPPASQRPSNRPEDDDASNKPNSLVDAILVAAASVGRDRRGKGGLAGYLRWLAKTEPKAFAQLLGRTLKRDREIKPELSQAQKEEKAERELENY